MKFEIYKIAFSNKNFRKALISKIAVSVKNNPRSSNYIPSDELRPGLDRASVRRRADQFLDQARRSMKNQDVGPHIKLPGGGQVAAYRENGKIRYEVIAPRGGFADFNSAGAGRAIANLLEDLND